jgi:signal transduction histidine kinase
MGAGRDLFGLRKDGSEFAVEIGLNSIETDDGLYVVAAITDITERKRDEAALRAAYDGLETALRIRTQEISEANRQLEIRVDGYERAVAALAEQTAELDAQRLVAINLAKEADEARQLAERRGEQITYANRELERENATRRRVELALLTTVAERDRAKAQLTRSVQQLERSNVELEQFAYVASHDLQEPLRAITGYCAAVVEDYGHLLDGEARKYLDFAVDGATRLRQLIDELFELSRVGRDEQHLQSVDCGAVVERVREALSAALAQSDATLVVGKLPIVLGEPGQLFLLFQNLVGNAIKYRRAETPPVIEITCCDTAEAWKFSVRDNGIGIESQHFNRIFQIFQRLHPRTRYAGTGIGLALCRKIAERHGGGIGVESTPGSGSVFTVTIAKLQTDLHD